MDALELVSQLKRDRGLRLVVLDFDLTLPKTHTGGVVLRETATPDYFRSLVYDAAHFCSFVKHCQRLGLKLAVASFASEHHSGLGGKGLIKAFLDTVLGRDRAVLTGVGDIAAWYPFLRHVGKTDHLAQLQGQLHNHEVLLIDDDPAVLHIAQMQGYLTAQVPVCGLKQLCYPLCK